MTTQLITPNPDIPCTPGYCLQYVRETFGLPARYGSATEAWDNSPSQHRDRNFPAGMWTPVWYGLDREPLGHVVLLAPDGSVYSTSDNSTTPHHHPSLTDLEDYYAGWGWPLTYRGWTEDVSGYPVVADVSGSINFQSIDTPAAEEDDMFTDQDRANLQMALDDGHRARQVLDALEAGDTRAKVDAIHAKTANIPLNVLEARFPLNGGGSANVAGALGELLSHPADAGALDVDALVARLTAELPAAILADLKAKL